MFYLMTLSKHCIYGFMVSDYGKDQSESEKRNLVPLHGLLFLISSKESFICTIPQTFISFGIPVIKFNDFIMRDRSNDRSNNEAGALLWRYISLTLQKADSKTTLTLLLSFKYSTGFNN